MGRPRKQVVLDNIEEEHIDEVARPTSAVTRSKRKVRTPINGYRNIMGVTGQEPGWHYCWVNDDNVPRHEGAGYEFVTHDVVVGDRKVNAASAIGGKVSLPVGNGVIAYLMRLEQEYYDEDMASYHAEIDENESAMRQNLNSKEDGRYGGVQISVRNRK